MSNDKAKMTKMEYSNPPSYIWNQTTEFCLPLHISFGMKSATIVSESKSFLLKLN